MKFKIENNSNLTIVDDKKEIIIHTDKFDLKELMLMIQEHLLEDIDETEIATSNKGVNYKFNPRSGRLERVIE